MQARARCRPVVYAEGNCLILHRLWHRVPIHPWRSARPSGRDRHQPLPRCAMVDRTPSQRSSDSRYLGVRRSGPEGQGQPPARGPAATSPRMHGRGHRQFLTCHKSTPREPTDRYQRDQPRQQHERCLRVTQMISGDAPARRPGSEVADDLPHQFRLLVNRRI